MPLQCWPTVLDAGPTLEQHWANASRLLGRNSISCLRSESACIFCTKTTINQTNVNAMLNHRYGAGTALAQIRVNRFRRSNAGLMPEHLLRNWPSVNPISDGRHLFARLHICMARILVEVTINRRLLIGRDGPGRYIYIVHHICTTPNSVGLCITIA